MDPITAHEQLKRERRAAPPGSKQEPDRLPPSTVNGREGWDPLRDLLWDERDEVPAPTERFPR